MTPEIKIEVMSQKVNSYLTKRTTYNVELAEADARLFRIFLRGLGVKFETSGVGFLTHFEIELLEASKEYVLTNAFLEAL